MSTLEICLVQYDIQWLKKAKNLAHLDELMSNVDNVDLIVLPETFATGFSIDVCDSEEPLVNSKLMQWLRQKSSELQAVVMGSMLVSDGDKKVNRLVWMYPDGETSYYDKRHLFRMGNEQAFVNPGVCRRVFTVNGIRILPQVCYDLRFPVWSRNRQDYDVMINVANWPAARHHVWETLLKARAIENQAFVIGVNRIGTDGKGVKHIGGTSIYSFDGTLLKSAPDNQEALVYCSLDITKLEQFKLAFPAYLDADEFDIRLC